MANRNSGLGLALLVSAGIEGSLVPAVTSWPAYPSWSPDVRALTFSRDVGGNLDIYVVGRNGGRSRRPTTDPALEFHPRWGGRDAIVYACAIQFRTGTNCRSS